MKKECNGCKNCKEIKERGDETSWFKCEKTGRQLYNVDRYQEAPKDCPLNKND